MNLPNAYDRTTNASKAAPASSVSTACEIVIVDPHCDRYADFVSAAVAGIAGYLVRPVSAQLVTSLRPQVEATETWAA